MSELSQIIANVSIERALVLSKLYGNLAWRNHVSIYEARDLEDSLFSKCKQFVVPSKAFSPQSRSDKILHVLGEGYESGGHTRVVERLAACSSAANCQDLLITDLFWCREMMTTENYQIKLTPTIVCLCR